jgi:hypothetical protein
VPIPTESTKARETPPAGNGGVAHFFYSVSRDSCGEERDLVRQWTVAVSELQSAPPLDQVGIGDKHKANLTGWARDHRRLFW